MCRISGNSVSYLREDCTERTAHHRSKPSNALVSLMYSAPKRTIAHSLSYEEEGPARGEDSRLDESSLSVSYRVCVGKHSCTLVSLVEQLHASTHSETPPGENQNLFARFLVLTWWCFAVSCVLG